jgi:hypothetical protein
MDKLREHRLPEGWQGCRRYLGESIPDAVSRVATLDRVEEHQGMSPWSRE